MCLFGATVSSGLLMQYFIKGHCSAASSEFQLIDSNPELIMASSCLHKLGNSFTQWQAVQLQMQQSSPRA